MIGHFLEEHDIGPHRGRRAGAAEAAGRKRIAPMETDPAIPAKRGKMRAMHMQEALGTRPFVEVINILGHDQQRACPDRIKPGKREMSGVGLHGLHEGAAHVIKAMDELRIGRKRLGSTDILDTVAFPEATRSPKGGNTAFGGNSRAGQDDNGGRVWHRHIKGV